ncbi:hypothetical protein AQ490_08105 [Wenjunlia vitaminophila]|uniref:Mycothiol-dependent maleylpyruvate isomerase metal-binding domain-containing protein n=1 Tax=Wenjunlia vitaminophila TaxID=76728 RepID=A0A0T6LNE6_WENVI|nr:maleylpyruvate isomerase family mycothiol-dependent enzyme [Wenjunlia vitaminophila]KRV47410.1 hypothetical protein AQ490_08105 [Wenjunlia vitaminophila]
MTVHQNLQPYVDAWTHSIEAISELCAPLSEGEWNRATSCPGWSVRDIVSHVIGVECELLGDPRPIHTLPRDLRHVVDERSRYTEVPVDVRRCHTGPEMTAELEYTIIRRSRQLRNETRGPEATVRGPMGREVTLERLLTLRAIDVWVHEQDVRRALGRPGNLDSPGGQITREWLVTTLPKVVAKDAGAAPNSAVVFDVHGAIEFMRTVRVDAKGWGSVDGRVSLGPAVTLSMDWETYFQLQCGRVRPGAAQVKVEGDQQLGQAIMAAMAVTP